MPTLDEILSRLSVTGATTSGGSTSFAYQLPILNSQGVLDPSFFSTQIIAAVYHVSDQTARLALTGLKSGDVVIQDSPARSYILRETPSSDNDNWELIGVTDIGQASNITFDDTGLTFTAADVQEALEQLDSTKVSKSSAATITVGHTFNTGGAPFILGGGSIGSLVTGLNADLLDGQEGSYYRNASNLNAGTVPSARLTGTYAISITGNAATASTATTAGTATTATTATTAGHATTADSADEATDAVNAENADKLDAGGGVFQAGSYFRNAANLNAGILAGARFDDTSHGSRAGGSLHALANETEHGFLSYQDYCKLLTVQEDAEENANTFVTFIGTTGSTTADSKTDSFTFASGTDGLSIAVTSKTATFSFDVSGILHGDLGGLDADDHEQYVHISSPRTITAVHTFNPSGGVPFIVGTNARGSIVTGLNADLLDSQHGSYYTNASNLSSGIVPVARLSGTYNISISGSADGSLPLTGGELTGPLIVPVLTIDELNGILRAIDGEVSTGATTDDLDEGANLYYTNERVDDRVAALIQNGAHITWTYNDNDGTLTGNVDNIPETTDDLPEGEDNLYLTVARVRASLSGVAPISYNSSTGAISALHDSANTASTLVFRDSNGDFAARYITVTTPVSDNQAANKIYVDTQIATRAATVHSHTNATITTPGFMSAEDKVKLEAISNLVDADKKAKVFCPTFRLETPISPSFQLYRQNSIFVKGDPDEEYELEIRIRGWAKKNHDWQLVVSSPSATLQLNTHTTVIRDEETDVEDYYEYIDTTETVTINGRARLTLQVFLRDGLLPDSISTIFPNVPPSPTTFNGGFFQIDAVSIVGPFDIYSKDVLPVSIEGEMQGGLLSGYTAIDPLLQGESSDDPQDTVQVYEAGTTDPFPTFSLLTDGVVTQGIRPCSLSAFNKTEGFNGFLRPDPFILGRYVSKPLALTSDVSDVLLNSGKFFADITSQSFTIGSMTFNLVVTGSTTLGDIFTQVAAQNSGNLDLSYDPETDQIIAEDNKTPAESEILPAYFSDITKFPAIVRLTANEDSRQTAISTEVASGIRVTDTLKAANFKQAVYPDEGSFVINGVTFEYDATVDTVESIMDDINDTLDDVEISYDPLTNDFRLEYTTPSLLPPKCYDVIGTFLQATNLQRESHGNYDFPVAAVHKVEVVNNSIFVGGSFRNYGGATTMGLAKLDYNGKLNYMFNTGVGFDEAINYIVALTGTSDVLVGALDSTSFKGFNRKQLFRITQLGNENTTFNLPLAEITKDGQDRILGLVVLNTSNDIAVVTPRALFAYSNTGAELCRYTATRQLTGIASAGTNKIILSSTAYSNPISPQRWNNIEEPLGLKLLNFDEGDNSFALDDVWMQTPDYTDGLLGPGGGTGAEASCAYPLVVEDEYVLAGNRGILFGSGVEDGYGDTSWNSRDVGNLLLRSDKFYDDEDPSGNDWIWTKYGDVTITDEVPESAPTENYTTIERSSEEALGYVGQDVDVTVIRQKLDEEEISNPGEIRYRFMVRFVQDDDETRFPVIALQLKDSPAELTVFAHVNTKTGDVFLGAPTPGATGVEVVSNEVEDLSGGPSIFEISIAIRDNETANTNVRCLLYPAYSSVFGGTEEILDGGCVVAGASLMIYTWPAEYTRTLDERKYPMSGSNAAQFRGIYKIGLAEENKGKADEAWNCKFEYSEDFGHAIPFCVDSENRVYFGGPISAIQRVNEDTSTTMIPVTPWGLYRLTEDGSFDKEYNFNDQVLDATITSCGKLVVGGRFNCYGKRFCGKLAFLSTDGELLDSLVDNVDIVASIVEPDVVNEPCNKKKLWLDISEVPPEIKVWNEDNNNWEKASMSPTTIARLPKPEFTTEPAGVVLNPNYIYITVPGFSSATIYYAVNADPLVLANRRDYNPLTGVVISDEGTFTINTYATKTDFEDSFVASKTFTLQPALPAVQFSQASGTENPSTVSLSVVGHGDAVIYYRTTVNSVVSAESLYSTALQINQNVTITARATKNGYRDGFGTATYTVKLNSPTLTYDRINDADVDSSPIGLDLATDKPGAIIRYTTNGVEPTLSVGSTFSSTIDLLNDSLYVNNAFTLKAKVFHVANGTSSDTVTQAITRLAVPVFTPGTSFILEDGTLTLVGSGITGETIRYTINGAAPTEDGAGGTTYTVPIVFTEEQITDHEVNLKVRVFRLGNDPTYAALIPSSLIDRTYTVQGLPPSIEVVDDETYGIESIEINTGNPDLETTIRYTTNGATPSKTSTVGTTTYTEAISIYDIPEIDWVNNAVTIKAIEFQESDDYTPAVSELVVTRKVAPVITPVDNIIVFTDPITVTSEDTVRFSINSTVPITSENFSLYDEDDKIILVNDDVQNGVSAIRARAFGEGYAPSSVALKSYNLKLPAVYFDPFTGAVNPANVKLLNLVQGVTIKYTTNGATPTAVSKVYSEPLSILVTSTVKAIATKNNWVDSDVAEAVYTSTLYPDAVDHSLFNIKTGKAPLNESAVPNAYEAEDFAASGSNYKAETFVEFTSTQYNVTKSQRLVRGKAVFGIGNLDFWNIVEEADNEYWQPIRNFGAVGNYSNHLEVRKYFGTTDTQLIDPDDDNDAEQDEVPILLQNTGLKTAQNNILLHVRGLAAGKYLLLAYGQKTRFGLDMYSGECLHGTKFYDYGYPTFTPVNPPEARPVFETITASGMSPKYVYFGTTAASEDEDHTFLNATDGLWYSDRETFTTPFNIYASETDVVTYEETSAFQCALIEAVDGQEMEFHITGTYDAAVPGTNNDSLPVMNGLQIIPYVELIQPTVNDEEAVEEFGPFDQGEYALFHVHGAVNVNRSQPKYAGGFYRFVHSIGTESNNADSPVMVDADSPSGEVLVSDEETGFEGWKAMDGSEVTYWLVDDTNGSLQYNFDTASIIDRYRITADRGATAKAPKAWTFEGFLNGSWVVLDTREDQFSTTSGVDTNTYVINTPVSCTNYRLVVTEANGTQIKIIELKLLGALESSTAVTEFINLPEYRRYITGTEACAGFTGRQHEFNHGGGMIQIQYEDIPGHYADNIVYPGLTPPTDHSASSNPVAPIFVLLDLSTIMDQGQGVAGLPVEFDPESGEVDPEAIEMFVTDKPVDTIYYTIDGSTPTQNSLVYTTPVELLASTTIKAFAVFEDGIIGPVSEATYTISPILPTPTFNPPSGANTPTSVTITCAESGTTIYYTTNGTTPSDTNGTTYTTPVSVSGTATLKAIAYKTGWRKSLVGTASYAPPDYSSGTLPSVVFSPATSAQPYPVLVTMAVPGHPTATILYTTNGTTPNYSSAIYTGPITVGSAGDAGPLTVKAFALKLTYAPSAVSQAIYTKAQAPTPTYSPAAGPVDLNTSIAISSTLSGATIYYSVDGSTPTPP